MTIDNIWEYDPNLILTGNNSIFEYGSFDCSLRHCKTKKHGKIVIKCTPISGSVRNIQNDIKKRLLSQLEPLRSLTHANLLQCHGICFWDNYYGVMMDYMSLGSLGSLICDKEIDIHVTVLARISLEISSALVYLHNFAPNKALVHGDIKPQNILLTIDLRVKVCDFETIELRKTIGASRRSSMTGNSLRYTLLFTAPEYLKDCNLARHPKMDVYSYSMVLYESLARTPVFHSCGVADCIISDNVIRGIRPEADLINEQKVHLNEQERVVFETMENLMVKCYHGDANSRPHMIEVKGELEKILENLDMGNIALHACKIAEKGMTKREPRPTCDINIPLPKATQIHVDEPNPLIPLERDLITFSSAQPSTSGVTSPKSASFDKLDNTPVQPFKELSIKKPHNTSWIFVLTKTDILRFDIGDKTFLKLPIIEKGRFYGKSARIAFVDNVLYFVELKDMFSLNLSESDTMWVKRSSPNKTHLNPKIAIYEGKIYFGADSNFTDDSDNSKCSISSLNEDVQDKNTRIDDHIELYTPNGDNWTVKLYISTPNKCNNMIVINDMLLIIGKSEDGTHLIWTEVNPESEECKTSQKSLPENFPMHIPAVLNSGMIYFLGTSNTKAWVVRNGGWISPQNLKMKPTLAKYFCNLDERLYGFSGTAASHLWKFDPTKDDWKLLATDEEYSEIIHITS